MKFLEAFVFSGGGCWAEPPREADPSLEADSPLEANPPSEADPTQRQTPPLEADPFPLDADPRVLTSSGGHCSGWYASYWNAFLLEITSELLKSKNALGYLYYEVGKTEIPSRKQLPRRSASLLII